MIYGGEMTFSPTQSPSNSISPTTNSPIKSLSPTKTNSPTIFKQSNFLFSNIDGVVINGENANDNSGWDVSSAGDVNGDGFDDILVSSIWRDPGIYIFINFKYYYKN